MTFSQFVQILGNDWNNLIVLKTKKKEMSQIINSKSKKALILFFGLICCMESLQAQVLEINPNVQWKYVRSQQLELKNQSTYQYEFPAERGYDYIFSAIINESGIETYVKVFDIQMKPIAGDGYKSKTNQLQFRVPSSGTYIVTIAYKGPDENKTTPIDFTLIRRPIVE
jgi:hypothetical protein